MKIKLAIIISFIIIYNADIIGQNITNQPSYIFDIPYEYEMVDIIVEDIKWRVDIPEAENIFNSIMEQVTTDEYFYGPEKIHRSNNSGIVDLPIHEHTSQVISLIKDGKYNEADKLIDSRPDYMFFYPQMNDLKIIIYYATDRYDEVIAQFKYASKISSLLYFDSVYNTTTNTLEPEQLKRYLSLDQFYYINSKKLLHQKKYDELILEINKIDNETYRFLLFKEYSKSHTDGPSEMLYNFNLKDENYKQYPTYIDAIRNLKTKNYDVALKLINSISSTNIDRNLIYYKGLAISNVELEKSEPYLINSLINEKDNIKLANIKFMLAQYYVLHNDYDDALQLIDNCKEEKCLVLRSVIYLKTSNYSSFLDIYDNIKTDYIYFLKAIKHFNNGEYYNVLEEVKNIKLLNENMKHLIMLTHFKLDNISEAIKIIEDNNSNKLIFTDGLKELYDLRKYAEIRRIFSNKDDIPDKLLFIKAKLEAMNGYKEKAREIYTYLVENNVSLYEAFNGLEKLEDTSINKLNIISNILDKIENMENFNHKDKLLYNFSEIALQNKDNLLLVKILNNFFSTYDTSEYYGKMYAIRGYLLFNTGRYQECLDNINEALRLDHEIEKNIEFKKAECTEGVSSEDSLDLYKNIANNINSPSRVEASLKIIHLSKDINDILKYSLAIENDNVQGYITGIRTYLEMVDPKELDNNLDFINNLVESKTSSLKAAGYFALARVYMYKQDEKKAKSYYNKLIKTFPKDYFSKKNTSGKNIKEILNIK